MTWNVLPYTDTPNSLFDPQTNPLTDPLVDPLVRSYLKIAVMRGSPCSFTDLEYQAKYKNLFESYIVKYSTDSVTTIKKMIEWVGTGDKTVIVTTYQTFKRVFLRHPSLSSPEFALTVKDSKDALERLDKSFYFAFFSHFAEHLDIDTFNEPEFSAMLELFYSRILKPIDSFDSFKTLNVFLSPKQKQEIRERAVTLGSPEEWVRRARGVVIPLPEEIALLENQLNAAESELLSIQKFLTEAEGLIELFLTKRRDLAAALKISPKEIVNTVKDGKNSDTGNEQILALRSEYHEMNSRYSEKKARSRILEVEIVERRNNLDHAKKMADPETGKGYILSVKKHEALKEQAFLQKFL